VNYRVQLSRQAANYLRRLGRNDQERIARWIDQIAANPYGLHTKPLTHLPGRRAARVGGYRLVFTVDDEAQVVNISDIGPRGQVYRRL
jgi:mRNA-degrading endonuclease RelE of RelBE toxin-antitoxin system